jgi:hypothetical protein
MVKALSVRLLGLRDVKKANVSFSDKHPKI